jgi:hypothetical protein
MTDEEVETLRVAVYRNFAESGTPGSPAVLATQTGQTEDGVRAGLRRLHAQRHLVLDSSGQIVMAHPFSAIPLGFSVMGRHVLWWGGCAWDSFALPHLVANEPDVLVATRCPNCDRPHAWVVSAQEPPPGNQVAHLLVAASRIWDDVVHTCAHQRIFCSAGCVTQWLAAGGHQHGYVMDLPTLWRLASRWYEGRLDHGYQRRDPTTASAYFYEVGLRGPFWGVDDQDLKERLEL